MPEVLDRGEHRRDRRVSERAQRLAADEIRHARQQVDVAHRSLSAFNLVQQLEQPVGAFGRQAEPVAQFLPAAGQTHRYHIHPFILDNERTVAFGPMLLTATSWEGEASGITAGFGALGGFRIERESGTSDLQKLDSTLTRSYWNVFPSAHLSYTLSKSTDLKLSYSRRISRPRARDLNPFAEYRDPKNISYGNPLLVPEYIHSVELALQYQSGRTYVQPSLFYRHSSNDISPIKQVVNRTTLQTTKHNVASEETAGIELICSFWAGDVFSTRVSTTGLYDQLDATNVGGGTYKSNVSWSGTLTANVNVAKETRFEIHTHWNSLRLTPQGERFPNAVLNVGVRQGLLAGKLTLTATLSDVFNTLKRHDELDIPRLQQSVFNTRDSRVLFVGFTYRFGSVPKKNKEEEEFRNDDDD